MLAATEVRASTVESILDDVEYLSRSPYRYQLLSLLAERPLPTGDLTDATGASRATLSRILHELIERRWIAKGGRNYRATTLGRFVVTEFSSFVDRLDTIHVLNGTARWFPDTPFDFDLNCLASAEVVTTSRTDAFAPLTHLSRQIGNSDRVSIVSYVLLPNVVAAGWERTVHGLQSLDVVTTPAVVESIQRDEELATRARAMVETTQVQLRCYDGSIPYVFVISDDEVTVVLFDEEGACRAVICSADPTVRSWAETTMGSYVEESRSLRVADFEP